MLDFEGNWDEGRTYYKFPTTFLLGFLPCTPSHNKTPLYHIYRTFMNKKVRYSALHTCYTKQITPKWVTTVMQCTVHAAIGLAVSVMQILFKIKWFYSIETQKKKHTITSTLAWLHVSVFPRPSSGQNFSVQGTIGVHYTLWDVVYLQHYEGVYYQLWRYFHYKNFVDYMVN